MLSLKIWKVILDYSISALPACLPVYAHSNMRTPVVTDCLVPQQVMSPQGEGYIYLSLLSDLSSINHLLELRLQLHPGCSITQHYQLAGSALLFLPASDHTSPWPMRGDWAWSLPLRFILFSDKNWEDDLFMAFDPILLYLSCPGILLVLYHDPNADLSWQTSSMLSCSQWAGWRLFLYSFIVLTLN